MGLKDWFIHKEITNTVNDAQSGKDGTDVAKVFDWIKAHRALFGWLFTFVAGGVASTGHQDIAKDIGIVSALLLGAGHFESDASKQSK